MGTCGLVVASLVVAGCGRIGFGLSGDTDGGPGTGSDTGGDGGGMLDDAAPVRSCSGVEETCGPSGTSSCCGSLPVPGGTFFRGYDVASDGENTDMTNPATVSAFQLDTYEVTVGRFRQFVAAGMGTQANPPAAGAGARALNGAAGGQGGWEPAWNAELAADTAALVAAVKCGATYQSWTDTPGANEALPMNCITWWEAFAFCVWDGGFLPTDAELNFAAVGGSEHRAYPWSSPAGSLTLDCSYANYFTGSAYCESPSGGVARVGSRSPIGDGRYGHADLAGNVFEWALDWDQGPYTTPCADCADLTPTAERVTRGGGYFAPEANLRGAFRIRGTPDSRDEGLGVRCAR